MNKKRIILIITLGLLIALAGCQQAEVVDEEAVLEEIPPVIDNEEQAYPVEDEIFPPAYEMAYPITEEDLERLMQNWTLVERWENDVQVDMPAKTIRFNPDGSFEISSDGVVTTGSWSAQLMAVESLLILNPGTEAMQTYQILELDESLLSLGIFQDGMYVEESYQPAD